MQNPSKNERNLPSKKQKTRTIDPDISALTDIMVVYFEGVNERLDKLFHAMIEQNN